MSCHLGDHSFFDDQERSRGDWEEGKPEESAAGKGGEKDIVELACARA